MMVSRTGEEWEWGQHIVGGNRGSIIKLMSDEEEVAV